MSKVRLIDIAKETGVSTVTVHNALTGNKGVSTDMRMRIVETAKRMGYEPLSSAKKEKKPDAGEFRKIGVLIAENYLAQYATYYWKVYQELSLVATEKRCYTTIEVLKKEAEKRTFELPQIVKNNSIEGLILIGEIDKRYIRKLRAELEMPIVFLDFYDNEIAKDAVIADNFYGMYQMTELLFSYGMESLAFVGSIYATSSIMDRYCGFTKSMMEHHNILPGEWLLEDRDSYGNLGLKLPHYMPDAFVCNCDLTACMLIAKLKKAGYRIPDDISVVGFDHFVPASYAGMGMEITTYEIDQNAMAKAALDKVLKQIRTPKRIQHMEIIPGNIRIKNSIRRKSPL